MSFPVRMLDGLGVVASKKRDIKPGHQFNGYFPAPSYNDPVITTNGSNDNTLETLIPNIITRYLPDTAKIASVLRQPTTEATARAIFSFCYNYIQYNQDNPGEEQIRRPARTWADRTEGVDCDCYTVFISTILLNTRTPHAIRMAAYNDIRGYQHIYVIVPKHPGANLDKRGDYWVIDPVLDAFDAEKPYLYKRDRVMLAQRNKALSGVAGVSYTAEPMVYANIYYHPNIGTWSMRGLNGVYYLNGNYDQRVITPLEGVNNLGIIPIDTGIRVGARLARGVRQLINRRRERRANRNQPSPQPSRPGNANAPTTIDQDNQLPAQVNPTVTDDNVTRLLSANESVKNLVNSRIIDSNKATVLSLRSVDAGIKNQITRLAATLTAETKRLQQNGASIQDITTQLRSIALNALQSTNSLKQEQAEHVARNKELVNMINQEQRKAEQFRHASRDKHRLTLITLAAISVVLLYIAIKRT